MICIATSNHHVSVVHIYDISNDFFHTCNLHESVVTFALVLPEDKWVKQINCCFLNLFSFHFVFQDEAGDTPLFDAIADEKHIMADMLLNHPRLLLEVTNGNGFNYLHFAVLKGNKQ